MSEEQPNFKVTDRRLFNADGTPRDLPAEEPTEAKAAAPADAFEPPPQENSQSEPEPPPPPPSMSDENPDLTEEELAEARDPASFISFVMSIASNAASALGMMEHPVTHRREVDPELGKHWIDILGMLQRKTSGNLSLQERNMLEGLLADLRMQYVSIINAAPKARTFTGSDITGGR
ncbi:MAG TPA: DUF1844 domain-containing protein [Pyrinomonadaceae bacterium]|nr:DUF1844 domain-containing protein [Pyrinomonadaceae bacterium]